MLVHQREVTARRSSCRITSLIHSAWLGDAWSQVTSCMALPYCGYLLLRPSARAIAGPATAWIGTAYTTQVVVIGFILVHVWVTSSLGRI